MSKKIQDDFRYIVVRALLELGNFSKRQWVLEWIEENVVLDEYDLGFTRGSNNNDCRFKNWASWKKKDLMTEGVLMNNAPIGYWAIDAEELSRIKTDGKSNHRIAVELAGIDASRYLKKNDAVQN